LLAGAAPRVGRTGDGGVRGGGAPVCKREESSVVVVRGGPGSGRPLFIGGIRRFGRPIFRARRASMAGNGGSGNIPAWTPAGGIRSQSSVVGLDPSCRRAGRGRGGGERRCGAVVLEGTAWAEPLRQPRSSGVRGVAAWRLTGRLGRRSPQAAQGRVACCAGELPGHAAGPGAGQRRGGAGP
jgi:hypothetical protein